MLFVLGTVALGTASYHLLAHFSTLLKKEPPQIQRTRLGFGLAILSDLSAYSLALLFLAALGTWPWYWPALALGVIMHAAYGGVFLSERIYRRIHHYENPDIFRDGQFVQLKQLLLFIDTLCHVASVWAIATHVSAETASMAFVMATGVFAMLWAKKSQEQVSSLRTSL